jgi:uncharacterized protein (DUF2249 family)
MSEPRKFKTLDVRPILARGEEPFAHIRATLDRLGPGEGLSVIAPFLPSPLIEKLSAEGMKSRVQRQPGSSWITYFWKE